MDMEVKEAWDTAKRIENTFNELTNVVIRQKEEIKNLKQRIVELQNTITELELRPPTEGGSLYQNAKESFERQHSS